MHTSVIKSIFSRFLLRDAVVSVREASLEAAGGDSLCVILKY